MSLSPLDVTSIPLEGTNLIEASAGTGKTHAITSLYLRLILEHNLPLESILVVTYTRAATSELRRRIRERLRQALTVLESEYSNQDSVIERLVSNGRSRAQSQRNLRLALINFDEASVFTIHGFCQRILSETTFESGLPFESELLIDETDLLKDVVSDYWRRTVYPASSLWIDWLSSKGVSTPDDLIVPMKRLIGKPYLKVEDLPEVATAHVFETELAIVFRKLADIWSNKRDDVIETLESHPGLNRRTYPAHRVQHWISQMTDFLDNDLFSYSDWRDFKNFDRFRASFINSFGMNKKINQPPKHEFFDVCEELAQCFEVLERSYKTYYASWWHGLYEFVKKEMSRRKLNHHQTTYDDLLINLQTALRSPKGSALAESVRNNYKALLVDEFQDTDPIQYEIFRHIFRDKSYPFFMIGDPKQAIYSFRGADIFAYFRAREDVSRKYTMVRNYRSVPGLVTAINTLFKNAGNGSSFFFRDIHFSPVIAAADIPEFRQGGEDSSSLIIWPISREGSIKPMPKYQAASICAEAVAAEVTQLLSMPSTLGNKRVEPSDIAILVRTHQEGLQIEAALKKVTVPSSRCTQESVFETEEALELELILRSIEQPSRPTLMRAALLTNLFGYDAEEVLCLSEIDRSSGNAVDSFQNYHDLWVKGGFMYMFREFASTEGIFQRLLDQEDGETRLTNLLHLSELIAVRFGKHGEISATMKWLSAMRDHPPIGEDEFLVRLERDTDCVNILTLHASKGLQFPIVFLPFPWSGGLRTRTDKQIIFHDPDQSNQATVDFGSLDFEENQGKACEEELAETIRLLYVGLTRAESRAYVAWGCVNDADTSALAWLLHRPEETSDIKNSCSCIRNFSALADIDFTRALNHLRDLEPSNIAVRSPPVFEQPFDSKKKQSNKELSVRKLYRRLGKTWSLTSFSSLTIDQDPRNLNYDLRKSEKCFSETDFPNDMFFFPKGIRAGNFIHQLFEQTDFLDSAASSRRTVVRHLLNAYGFSERWLDVVFQMLTKVMHSPLNGSGSLHLSKVPKSRRISEMEFYYPISGLRSTEFFELLADHEFGSDKGGGLLRPIEFSTLPGFMNGYIDLVFEIEDRFWIVDYKSHHLGNSIEDYRSPILETVMARERYALQYLIYTLAVHRFLKQKLDNYEYDRHFGGVYYLFVRGMDPRFKDNGVFFDRPSLSLIQDLEELVVGGDRK